MKIVTRTEIRSYNSCFIQSPIMDDNFKTFTEEQPDGLLSHIFNWMNKKPHEHPPYIMFTIVSMSTVVSVSLYRTAYYIMLKSGIRYDVDHRFLGIFKGLFAVISAYILGGLNQRALDGPLENTWGQTAVLLVSNGYYVHDSIYFVYYSIDDIINLAHHVITVIVLSYSMVIGKFANVVMFYNWAFEATTIPLHFRYIMRNWKMRTSHPQLFTTTELTFILMYVVQRFLFGIHFSFYIIHSGSELVPFVGKLLCVFLNVASVAWYNSICLLFKRRYGEEFEFLKDFFPV